MSAIIVDIDIDNGGVFLSITILPYGGAYKVIENIASQQENPSSPFHPRCKFNQTAASPSRLACLLCSDTLTPSLMYVCSYSVNWKVYDNVNLFVTPRRFSCRRYISRFS
jgi:hypothetical protein